MIAIIVENCAGCPFVNVLVSWWCTLVDRETQSDQSIPPPDWCPLREGDRLVTLGVKP